MSRQTGFLQAAHEELPEEQRRALRSAVKWQIFTLGYAVCTVTLVAFVLSGSQAMTTAWIEDILSIVPQLSFLVALLVTNRRPTGRHPYGTHRAMGVGHLLAGAALVGVGGVLAFDAVTGLIAGDRATIPDIELLGQQIWLGWIMIAVMVVVIVGPVFLYGPAKARLAPILHNKLLAADADMAKADWLTNVASIVGVLGIGMGIWWLDGAAAVFISIGIIRDGIRNCIGSIQDLIDRQARSVDDREPHPIRGELFDVLRDTDWILDFGIRMRDLGQVFHVEVFVVPHGGFVELARLGDLTRRLNEVDWKIQDVVIVPIDAVPSYADVPAHSDSTDVT